MMTSRASAHWRILIIDDDVDDRAELQRLLVEAGGRRYTFVEATTASEGLRAIDGPDGPPDCVLLDHDLPDDQRDELLSQLTCSEATPIAPVVLITRGTHPDPEPSRRQGAEELVGKTRMTAESLVQAVENAVTRWCLTRELRASEARLVELAATVPAAVWMLDGAGRLIYANDRWHATFGAHGQACACGDWSAVYHPDDLHVMEQTWLGGKAFVRDVRLFGRGQRYRWYQVNAIPIMDAIGQTTRWYGVNTDVHAHKLAAQRAAVEHRVSQILGEARSEEQATPAILRALADGLAMQVSALWLIDGDRDLLACCATYDTGAPRFAAFLAQTRQMTCTRGHCLPGMTWRAGKPIWLEPVTASLRGDAARSAGLSSGVAFPVMAGDALLGVIEVFSEERLPADAPLLRLLGTLGHEIGQFILRKRAERAAENNAMRLRLALEASRTGIWTWELATDAVTWTPECYSICGLAPGSFEQSGAAFFELVHAEDRPRVEHSVRRAIAEREVYTCEFRMVAPDGRVRWVQNLGRASYAPDGTPLSVLGTVTDIDDRVRAMEALQRSEERLSRAQRAARIGTWDWDILTGEASWTAEAWRIFWGADLQAPVTYSRWLACIHPDDRASATRAVSAALDGATYRDEFRVCWGSGEVRWVESIGEVVFAPDGTPLRMLGTVHDVTERHASDHALRVALSRAEQVTRQKDQLVSLVSHDLRNPLGTIAMDLALLEDRKGQWDQAASSLQPSLERMARQVTTMTQMLDELLDLAALDAGQPARLNLRPTDLVELTRRLVRNHGQAAHHLAIEVQSTTERLVGMWDPNRLERVIDNLLSNAIKYSPKGGTIHVEIATSPPGGAVLRVQDPGIGIPASDQRRVFDWFSRAENVKQTSIRGTGIGLAGAKQIVEQHGGSISVESEEGKGSTFTVRLPLRPEAEDAPPPARRSPLSDA